MKLGLNVDVRVRGGVILGELDWLPEIVMEAVEDIEWDVERLFESDKLRL